MQDYGLVGRDILGKSHYEIFPEIPDEWKVPNFQSKYVRGEILFNEEDKFVRTNGEVSGLLIICTGKFTKSITEIQAQAKEYTGTIMVGATTPSYDLETEVNATFPTAHITEELILETTKQFLGEIDQNLLFFLPLKKMENVCMNTHALVKKSKFNREKLRFTNLKSQEFNYQKSILELNAAKELTFVR